MFRTTSKNPKIISIRLLWMKYRKISFKVLSNPYGENTRPIIYTVDSSSSGNYFHQSLQALLDASELATTTEWGRLSWFFLWTTALCSFISLDFFLRHQTGWSSAWQKNTALNLNLNYTRSQFLPKGCIAKCQDHTEDASIKCFYTHQSQTSVVAGDLTKASRRGCYHWPSKKKISTISS